jgi:very-short-patch-repair endonuclease/DNA polymerase III delta prime subunit
MPADPESTPSAPSATDPPWDTGRIRRQLRRWQERLLDLSKANPLLGLNRSRVSRLQVVEPPIETVFRELVVTEGSLRMPRVVKIGRATETDTEEESAGGEPEARYRIEPGDVAFQGSPIELHRKLRRIYDNARTSLEERGVTTLHLSFGVLRWDDPQLGESISPLWLVPCELESFGPSAPMKLSAADDEMQVNPALELYLRERHRVALPELSDDPDVEALAAFFEELRRRVREHTWTVEAEVWLATYSFESLVLYQDLKALAGVAERNRIIAALARATPLGEASESLGEEALDTAATPAQVPVPVLLTDSSQLKSLTATRAGKHLVVHGPPGTGKSQTISNLIADAIGQGKTVLFVSAKMAALDVVYRRLARLGLGRFCLEAHSTKAGKAKIIDELRRTLAAAEQAPGSDRLDEHLEEFLRVRDNLNAYVRALHERRASFGHSAYEVIGKAERLRNEADVRGPLPWTDLLAVTRADFRAAVDALIDLGSQAHVFDRRELHPWRGLAVDPGRPVRRDLLESDLTAVRTALRTLLAHLSKLDPLLGPTISLTFQALHRLAGILFDLSKLNHLPRDWATREPHELDATAGLLDEAAARADEESSKLVEHDRAWKLRPAEALRLLDAAESEFAGYLRTLRPAYWQWRRGLRPYLYPGAAFGFTTLRASLARVRRLTELQCWFEQHGERIAAEVGTTRLRDTVRLREASDEARVASRLRTALVAEGLVPPAVPATLTEDLRRAAGEIAGVLNAQAWQDAIDRVDAAWPSGFVDGLTARSSPLPATLRRCDEVLGAPERAHEWIVLQHTFHRCHAMDLSRFIDSLGSLSARGAAGAFERRFYVAWAEAALETSPSLALFAGLRREEEIARFRQLDPKLREAALARIKAVASEPARRVAGARGGLGTSSEVGILRRELERQRRFKPLRKLFGEIPNVLLALKPCMLMSPLSVSTFLVPGTLSFDLVVFDEASQLPTPEGVPAMLRGAQVIVAGDSKQLPPTSFFVASVIMDEDRDGTETTEEFEPLESLLDDSVAVFPVFDQSHLRWHYRSHDERLITFSNHYFYREKPLITFPSAATDTEDRGVRYEYVHDGVWDRGGSRTNRAEARRVVNLIVEHAERQPERSLGVVAMNVAQREAIEELLDERLLEMPNVLNRLRANTEEPFFIKALENVQGDERDTMIISVGYGKTASGALSYNFGPLNQEGGWRRLNVLVTRARWQTILVTSMRASELSAVNPNNRGAVALRNFIEYAENGCTLPREVAAATEEETNDFEDAVAEALRARGFHLDQQVGASGYRIDLAIRDPRDPTRYVLGVECDGATYHGAKTARDRDLLREHVLKGLGWRLYRIWSTDWFRNREQTIDAAVGAVDRALQSPHERSVAAAPTSTSAEATRPDTTKVRSAPLAPQRQHPTGRPYQKYREAGSRLLLLDSGRRRALAAQLVKIVGVEGPIHRELLAERLKEVNDVARIGDNVATNISDAVLVAVRGQELERFDRDFLRCPDQKLATFRTPGDDVQRRVAWIPIPEIQLAILHIVEDQFGCQRDALCKAVAELFGFDRTPSGLAELVATSVDTLLEQRRLQASGPNVYLRDGDSALPA